MPQLAQKIKALFNQPVVSVLATVTEDGAPWARYVVPFMDPDMNLWVATYCGSRKVAQIGADPRVHLACGATTLEETRAWVQVEGTAQVLDDAATKKAMWQEMLAQYFDGPDDPNYCVIKITPGRMEYGTMGSAEPEVWQAG